MAAGSGHFDIVNLLLDNGADLSITTRSGWTSLICAASKGQSKIVNTLLEHGCNVNDQDIIKRSVVFYAVKSGNLQLVSRILEQDCSLVDFTDPYGISLLSLASRFGYLEIVRRLTSISVSNLAAQDCWGHTALWWAEKRIHTSIKDHLIKCAKDNCIEMVEPREPIGNPRKFNEGRGWCDICMVSVQNNVYSCMACYEFYVCTVCKLLGGHCLVPSHTLKLEE